MTGHVKTSPGPQISLRLQRVKIASLNVNGMRDAKNKQTNKKWMQLYDLIKLKNIDVFTRDS